jgi:XapX domain-containing protein
LAAYKELAYALVTGVVAGFAFAKMKLPIPAPPTLAGVLGIVGVFLGYLLAKR